MPEANGGACRDGCIVKTVILACNTIRDELEKVASETLCGYPFVWIESGLHLRPDSLRRRVQQELDAIRGVQRVLLGFGFCGNAVVGLRSGDFQLVFPKVDDCITVLLGSKESRERCAQNGGVYFLTKGWLEGEANIWREYEAVLERFGPERTERIYKRMLAHYRYLGLIDTGAYNLSALLPLVNKIADTLKLEARVLPGADGYLKKFLTGPWEDDDFVIVQPFTTVDLPHLGIDLGSRTNPLQGAC
jgi:hypothetical protein